METKQITTEQLEKVKELVKDFRAEKGKEFYVYCGTMFNSDYCHLLGIDYATIHLLGEVSYTMTYYEEGDKYQLACETFIGDTKNDKLSVALEDKEDFLGFFTKEEQKIGVARWLPSNWKELMSDEQKKEIAEEWCKEYSYKLNEYLDDSDREAITYAYMDKNSCTCTDYCYSQMDSCEQKDFIKECIDNL